MDRLTCMDAFVRVAEAGSFAEAARRWGRSRAVVSKYVQQLEAQLEVRLLERTTRVVVLTDAGRVHVERCQQVLALVAEGEQELRRADRSLRGVIRVSAPPGMGVQRLEHWVAAFVRLYPEVVLELDLTHRLVDLVEERIDVAIRLTEPEDSDLVARRLGPAPLVLVARPDLGIAVRCPADLEDVPCIRDTNFRFDPHWPFRWAGERQRVTVSGPVLANSPLVVAGLVRAGLGVGDVLRAVDRGEHRLKHSVGAAHSAPRSSSYAR